MTEENRTITDMYLRQRDIFDAAVAGVGITVIGAGSLGSWTVMGLAKLGFKNITVYDHDKVELHNLPSQFYGPDNVSTEILSMLKVVALHRNVINLTENSIQISGEFFRTQALSEIMICLVDNMAVRKQIFKRCEGNTLVKAFIDGRMGGQTYRIYTIEPQKETDCRFYMNHWYPDEQASQEECTARGVGYNAVSCAMDVVNLVKKVTMGQEYPAEIVGDSGGMWKTAEHWRRGETHDTTTSD